MSQSISTSDMTLTIEDVENLRKSMIELRDGALKQNDFGWAVKLSHVIIVLAWTIGAMK